MQAKFYRWTPQRQGTGLLPTLVFILLMMLAVVMIAVMAVGMIIFQTVGLLIGAVRSLLVDPFRRGFDGPQPDNQDGSIIIQPPTEHDEPDGYSAPGHSAKTISLTKDDSGTWHSDQ